MLTELPAPASEGFRMPPSLEHFSKLLGDRPEPAFGQSVDEAAISYDCFRGRNSAGNVAESTAAARELA